jgi:hypothetical protein
MSTKKFEFKLSKKSIKLNLEIYDVKKITLKFIGVYGKEKINFNAKVNIKLNPNNINKLIEKVEIVELEVNNHNNHNDYNLFKHNIYTLDTSSSSSSSSSCSSVSDEEIYNQVKKFVKNIKFIGENNKLSSMIFTLEKTNIKKIKLKGKIN